MRISEAEIAALEALTPRQMEDLMTWIHGVSMESPTKEGLALLRANPFGLPYSERGPKPASLAKVTFWDPLATDRAPAGQTDP